MQSCAAALGYDKDPLPLPGTSGAVMRSRRRQAAGWGVSRFRTPPARRPWIGDSPHTERLTGSVISAGVMHLGRRAQKHAELAATLEDARGADEADVGEPSAGDLLGKALPVESVMSVKVDLVRV